MPTIIADLLVMAAKRVFTEASIKGTEVEIIAWLRSYADKLPGAEKVLAEGALDLAAIALNVQG